MTSPSLLRRALAFVAGVALLAFSGWAAADPPSRVARLGYVSGAISFSPAGENDWVQASVNRPLTTGDRLWAANGSRAELQIGSAMVRLDEGTSVSVLNLDDLTTQLQLTQGTLNVRVRRLAAGETFEVATPNLAFTLQQPGAYRIMVDAGDNATTIIVRSGQGEVWGEDASWIIDGRQPYRFSGTDLRNYEYADVPRLDEFDRWASARDQAFDRSISARYVSRDVIGYQDLDTNGVWRVDATWGNVWYPSRVADGWAPYRDGHWAWVAPWGWTWIDAAPWGFAVSHYGRWTHLGGAWGWVPGPVRARAWYAPALVAFVGGENFQLSFSTGPVNGVAWFPLAPREVYRPSYHVSRGYFENINRSNTVINLSVVNNVYNNVNVTNVVHANRQVPGAIVAVPMAAFVQSQAVARAAVQVTREMIARRPVAAAANVAPTEKSVHGAAVLADKPPARLFERPVISHTARATDLSPVRRQPPATAPAMPARQSASSTPPTRRPAPSTAPERRQPASSAMPARQPAPSATPAPRAAVLPPPEPRGTSVQHPPVERRTRPATTSATVPAITPVMPSTPAVRASSPSFSPRPRPETTPTAPPEVRSTARPEPRATARQVESRPSAAAPSAATPQPQMLPRSQGQPQPQPQLQPRPRAAQSASAPKPAASKPDPRVREKEEQRQRESDNRR